MYKLSIKFLVIFVFMSLFHFENVLAAAIDEPLLRENDFQYLGAFKVPAGDLGGPQYHGLNYGGSVIGYNPINNSLFIVGHDDDQLVAEIGIPAIKQPNGISDITNLSTATVIQNLTDITEGNINRIAAGGSDCKFSKSYPGNDPCYGNGTKIGGLLKYGNKLIGSSFGYYDAGQNAVLSHFRSDLNFSLSGDFEGMFEVGSKPDPVPQAGFIAGYMCSIPSQWQPMLGGSVLSGQSALSILGRTSSGPAAFAFDPNNLGTEVSQVAALLYYPIDHQTIGTYYSSQTLYNKGSHHSGIVFPSGTRSVIFTGKQGIGEACYGPGTTNIEEKGNRYDYAPPNNTCGGVVMTDVDDPCCYDPVNLNKGAHAYPYVDYAWAYDALDFLRVKNGGRIIDDPSLNLVDGISQTSPESYKPWHIKPYATWEISFPTNKNSYSIADGASAYDEINKKLYIVQTGADVMRPLIHVFKINVPTSISAPSAPSELTVL